MLLYAHIFVAVYMSRKFNEAINTRNKQRLIFDRFSASFSSEQLQVMQSKLAAWEDKLRRWESNGHNPKDAPLADDPYQYPEDGQSISLEDHSH